MTKGEICSVMQIFLKTVQVKGSMFATTVLSSYNCVLITRCVNNRRNFIEVKVYVIIALLVPQWTARKVYSITEYLLLHNHSHNNLLSEWLCSITEYVLLHKHSDNNLLSAQYNTLT